jgi:UDP-N-acetylglucosamine 4,6-dehydratase
VRFVIGCIEKLFCGEVFIPKLPSVKVVDLARAIAPQAKLEVIGIRPGEKLHEVLIHEDEARLSVALDEMYIVQPTTVSWFGREWNQRGKPLPEGFRYSSETNPEWLDVEQIRSIVNTLNE